MSYDGFEQRLCANGHSMDTADAWLELDYFDNKERCKCGADVAWRNSVNQTNCCAYPSDHLPCPDYDGTCEGVGIGYVKLEVAAEAVYEECPHCHSKKLIKERTYKIPTKKDNKMNKQIGQIRPDGLPAGSGETEVQAIEKSMKELCKHCEFPINESRNSPEVTTCPVCGCDHATLIIHCPDCKEEVCGNGPALRTSTPTKIYIVEGSTGEWSDHREWPVVAYKIKDLAEAHVVLATRRSNELYALHQKDCSWDDDDDPHRVKNNEYDPNMQYDYNGTHYRIYEVDVYEKLHKFSKD